MEEVHNGHTIWSVDDVVERHGRGHDHEKEVKRTFDDSHSPGTEVWEACACSNPFLLGLYHPKNVVRSNEGVMAIS